jgi:hypothetical protein
MLLCVYNIACHSVDSVLLHGPLVRLQYFIILVNIYILVSVSLVSYSPVVSITGGPQCGPQCEAPLGPMIKSLWPMLWLKYRISGGLCNKVE